MAPVPANHSETLIRVVSEHWIKYLFPVFVTSILMSASVLIFWLAGFTAHHSTWISFIAFITGLTLFLLAHHWFFTRLFGETLTHVVITNRRVVWIHQSLFRSDQMREYAFEKMKTVEASKSGLLQTILRYGSLKFESGSDIEFVPHPNNLAKDIEQAMGMK